MNRILLPLALLLTVLTANIANAQRPERKITWVNSEIANVKGLEHKVLTSTSLGHDVGYVVWTPPNYDNSGKTRYPVVYFLHGAGGTEASDSGGFSSSVASSIQNGSFPPIICVFPNGGMSGYRDAVESMIIDELIPLIDQNYATKAKASGRALAGFSMGGAGSVRLSILHPDLFCAAGSWGGALSRQGSGEDSPLLPAAKAAAETLKSNHFALLTINGDQDHPEGFQPLNKILGPLKITHKIVTLADTKHNLGHYYERSGDTLLAFLAERLCGADVAAAPKRTVRVLTIGNSFAGNACKYLKEIAADGGVEFVIGTANLGGCTLERHASLAKQSGRDPSNKPYKRVVGSEQNKLSLQEYLVAEQWDYVTLQQMSALSFKAETFHPHIDELVALVRRLAPQARILIHETWAYRSDSPLLTEWGITQQKMHDGIVEAYAGVAKQFDATIIPVGSAFDKVRSTAGRKVVVPDPNYDFDNPVYPERPNQENSLIVGWYWDEKGEAPTLRLDFKHANTAGCYLAGLVWYEALTGNDAREINYTPQGVKDADQILLREVAHDVIAGREKQASIGLLLRDNLVSDELDDCRRESFLLTSKVLERSVNVRVVLPPDYDADNARSFPILYCLHGMGAPYGTFSEMAELRRRLKDKPVILAMFDGGVGSFYLDAVGDGKVNKSVLIREPKESDKLSGEALQAAVDEWAAIPARIPSLYTSFFFDEFVPAVDAHYRVDSQNRAVTGFSMGGFGAMHYMLERPGFFKSVSGLSSAFYSRSAVEKSDSRASGFFSNKLGEYSASAGSYDVVFQFERVENAMHSGTQLPPIYQHCGTDDRLLGTNERMAEHLKSLNCSVEFVSSPGGHNWDFWRDASPTLLDFHWNHFNSQ